MHTYGYTFENMRKLVIPMVKTTPWGSLSSVSTAFYHIEHIVVKKNHSTGLFSRSIREGTYYLSTGTATILSVSGDGKKSKADFREGEIFSIFPREAHGFLALEECSIYFFSGADDGGISMVDDHPDPYIFHPGKFVIGTTTDLREKYWGSIETIASREYCAKKIVMRQNTQNSLEVHCRKHETYWVEKGEVKVGIRVGRGENKSVSLKKGDIFSIPPGLMHMKIAKVECVVMEISTKDDDLDSHIVEDGMKYAHKED